jgi:hypothetical protein
MSNYKTPKGNIYSEEELRVKYEDRFDDLVSQGILTPATEEAQGSSLEYVTPVGNVYSEQELINKYGDRFNELVSNGTLKKKGDTGSSLEVGSSVSPITEEDYFTGTFGKLLNAVDAGTGLGMGDFIDDMARSIAQGRRQGIAAENASDLLLKGSYANLEDIQSFIDAQKSAAEIGSSQEMQDYQRIYEENGKGFMGVVLGLVKNPSVIAELTLSSMSAMANNSDAWLAASGVIGTGAGVGASAAGAAGTVVGPAGTVVGLGAGAIAGGLASLPYAFAAAGTVLEMGSTFAELLQEKAGGRELTKEVIQELLNNPEVYTDIRNKAVARGIAIGAIDAFTGKLGGKIGSKVLTKGGDIAADVASKGRKAASIAAAGGVEAVGGSIGEVGGRLAAGQEMDISEIALEGIAEVPGSVKDMIAARYAKPTYKVNGEKVPAETLDNLIETMTLEQLQAAKIQIDNDYDGRAGKLQNRVEELSTKKQIQEANPEINEPTLNEMAKLQLELNKLEGNKTEVAKTKASELKEKIKALQEAPLEEEVIQEVAQAEEVTEAVPEATTEEEFDQLDEEDQLSFLEQANGDRQSAINLFAEDNKKAQDIWQGTFPTETQEQVQTEESTQETVSSKTQTGTSVTNKSALDQVRETIGDKQKLSIIDSAQKVLTTLKSVLPNFDIIVHDSDDSYGAAMSGIDGNAESVGNFSYSKNEDGSYVGRIDINLNKANNRTVAHEVAHGIMLKTFGENPETFKTFRNRLSSVLSDSSNQKLMDFANKYSEIDSYEEYLAELTAALEQQEGSLSPSTIQKIASIINEFVSNVTNGKFKPFQNTKDTKQAIEFFSNISSSIRKGEAVNPADIEAIQQGLSVPIGSPTVVTNKAQKYSKLSFPEEPLPLSFVTNADKIDIEALIDDIIAKKQKVWFWMADQLGRGSYYDEVIQGEHYLDAGPSFALDPENRSKKILWASGLAEKTLANNINESDYIFFISGSPDKAKLFNKRVINLLEERINKTSDFNSFKEAINNFPKETVELKTLKEALNKVNSFKELADSSSRKPFLLAISNIGDLKTTLKGSLKELLESFNAFIDYNELRDGFYKENNFSQNDIMLVGKPTGLAGKANHSTYEFAIGGEVIGVPDKKVDSWEIMPNSVKEKYKEGYKFIDAKTGKEKTRGKLSAAQKIKIIAAETGIIRKLGSEVKSKAQLAEDSNVVKFIKDARAQGISEAAIKITLRRGGVSNEDIVSGLEKAKGKASVRTEISETLLDGYDRLMTEVDGIIKKSKGRGRTDEQIAKNVIEYIMGSKAYENATDVQREKLVRDARKMMGLKEKSAPSAGRLIGIIKDIKNITMSEKELLYKRLKDFEEGAKTAKQAWANASKQLAEEVSELEKKGKITASQMSDVLSKFSKVNMFNPASVERFIDYMSKVFNDADYANKMANANTKRKNALANVGTKIGISDILAPKLQKLFSINPSLIPMSVLDKYISLVNTFSQRKAVLSLPPLSDMINMSDDVLNAIRDEESAAMELADRFNATKNKVYNDDGSLNYADTLKEMLIKEDITEDELELMKKYKSKILPKKAAVELTEAEKEEIKKELIKEINNSDVMQISSLPSRDERNLAGRLERLLKTDGLKSLSINELQNILKVLDNINNGYLPTYAQLAVEQINAQNNNKQLSSSIKIAKTLPITAIYSRIKSIVTKKGAIEEMVRRNPLFYIDQLFGNYETKNIFDSLLGMASQASSKFRSELKTVQDKISKAEQDVINSFGNDHNSFVLSKYKQMAYMIQEEFLSNPNNKQVNNVIGFLKETIKRIDTETTSFKKGDADMLQSILKNFSNGDVFDNEALYNSFNDAEKRSIDTLQNINLELGPKAVYTAAIIRGDKIKPLENYVHLNVIPDTSRDDVMATASFIANVENRFNPSTKAKSLVERTGKISALNFDVYSSVQKSAKFVLMDYHLTEPIRTARRTLNLTEKSLTENDRMDSNIRPIFNAIKEAFNEATSNLLENSYTETSFGDEVFNFIKKQGYRAILASPVRFVGELTSNASFALIVDPKGFMAGAKLFKFITSPEALQAMNNLNSTETNRIFPTNSLSGKFVDTSVLNEAKGTKGSRAKSNFSNTISKLWNSTAQKWVNGVELTADALISTPDKLIMRPMWFGAFENRFKELTGKSPDFTKIAANDEAYMNENQDALKQARELADKRAVMAGSTDNAFMGMLKGTSKPNQSIYKKAFNAFNNFMSNFLINEYTTTRTGVMAMVGRGEMSQRQGAAVVAAVMTRMILYTLIGQMLAESLTGMFDGDDEEDELDGAEPKNKSIDKKLGQAFASAFTSLLFGRDFGNATKGIINFGVEEFNKEQLDFLREGDYDPYKDAIQYTIMPTEKPGRPTGISDFLMKFTAAYGPILKTADLIVRKATEPEKKTAEARQRQEDEKYVRIPLEVLGNLGFIPMYKDIRKVVLQNIYKDLEKAERTAGDKKKAKEEMLQGYESETDMKRYDRELWERTYGPNSPDYDAIKAKKDLDKEKRRIKQQLKDEMYNYTPKSKRKKKSENTFGETSF